MIEKIKIIYGCVKYEFKSSVLKIRLKYGRWKLRVMENRLRKIRDQAFED